MFGREFENYRGEEEDEAPTATAPRDDPAKSITAQPIEGIHT